MGDEQRSVQIVRLSKERVRVVEDTSPQPLNLLRLASQALHCCENDFILVHDGKQVFDWSDLPPSSFSLEPPRDENGSEDASKHLKKNHELLVYAVTKSRKVNSNLLKQDASECCCAPMVLKFKVFPTHNDCSAKSRRKIQKGVVKSIDRTTEIVRVRESIAKALGSPARCIRLVCSGRVLDDSYLVGDYDGLCKGRVIGVSVTLDIDREVRVNVALPLHLGKVKMHVALKDTVGMIRQRILKCFGLPILPNRWSFKLDKVALKGEDQTLASVTTELTENSVLSVFDHRMPFHLDDDEVGEKFSNFHCKVLPMNLLFDSSSSKKGYKRNPKHPVTSIGDSREESALKSKVVQDCKTETSAGERDHKGKTSSSNGDNNNNNKSDKQSFGFRKGFLERKSSKATSPRGEDERKEDEKKQIKSESEKPAIRICKNKIVCCKEDCKRLVKLIDQDLHRCRCELVFCGSHLHDHHCTFDFREMARTILEEQLCRGITERDEKLL